MLETLLKFFKIGEDTHDSLLNNNNEMLTKIQNVLYYHGMETWQLIHQYHIDRLKEQQAMTTASYGMLTVRMQFVHDLLRIEIMNGRSLYPMDGDGNFFFTD